NRNFGGIRGDAIRYLGIDVRLQRVVRSDPRGLFRGDIAATAAASRGNGLVELRDIDGVGVVNTRRDVGDAARRRTCASVLATTDRHHIVLEGHRARTQGNAVFAYGKAGRTDGGAEFAAGTAPAPGCGAARTVGPAADTARGACI